MRRSILLFCSSTLLSTQINAQDVKHVQSPMWSAWFTTPDQYDYSSKYAVGPGMALSKAELEVENLDYEVELESKQVGGAGHIRISPELGALLSIDRVWTKYEIDVIGFHAEDVSRTDTVELGAGYAIGNSFVLGLKLTEYIINQYDDTYGNQTVSYFTPTLGALVKLGDDGDLTVESTLDSSGKDSKTKDGEENVEYDYTPSTLGLTYNHQLSPTLAAGMKLSYAFYNRKNDEENDFYEEELKLKDKVGIGLMTSVNFGTSAYTQFILSQQGKAISSLNIGATQIEINPVIMLGNGGTIGGTLRYFFGKDRDNSGETRNKYKMDGYVLGLTGGMHI